jgi:hypothetical protein
VDLAIGLVFITWMYLARRRGSAVDELRTLLNDGEIEEKVVRLRGKRTPEEWRAMMAATRQIGTPALDMIEEMLAVSPPKKPRKKR